MDHYVDIRLLPDPEFPSPLLMNALFAKLHRALVEMESRSIGVSFPEVQPHKPSLGQRLRVHGTAAELERLMTRDWLTGMRDHVEVLAVSLVPAQVKHRRVRRVQPKSNAERLRRRYIKRHPEVTAEEAVRTIPETVEQRVKLPFLLLKSQSSKQHFRLFLEHLPIQEQPVKGHFNYYGLSSEATVPWF